jgi:hypothetical protein
MTLDLDVLTYSNDKLRADNARLRKVLEMVRKKARLAQALCVTTEDIEAEVDTALKERP